VRSINRCRHIHIDKRVEDDDDGKDENEDRIFPTKKKFILTASSKDNAVEKNDDKNGHEDEINLVYDYLDSFDVFTEDFFVEFPDHDLGHVEEDHKDLGKNNDDAQYTEQIEHIVFFYY